MHLHGGEKYQRLGGRSRPFKKSFPQVTLYCKSGISTLDFPPDLNEPQPVGSNRTRRHWNAIARVLKRIKDFFGFFNNLCCGAFF